MYNFIPNSPHVKFRYIIEYSHEYLNIVETGMELSFGRCMFSLLKFGGIGLFTCKMTLYTYYMRPYYMVYRKAQDFGSVA